MNSSPLKNAAEYYPVLIIGGGIVGAGIFRDLSLHQVPCLLVDKKDFASQTSQSSSKMLHGGIRYLETMDFALVHEALHEKSLWLKLAPHLCYEEEFYLPIYKDSARPLWMIKCGLMLYDFLSGFKNTPHKIVSVEDTLLQLPHLKQDNLTGSGVYHDVIVDDAKLTIEIILDALSYGNNEALNYVGLVDLKVDGTSYVAELRDTLTGEEKVVRTKYVAVTAGPFTDQLLGNLSAISNWEDKLLPSKGSHLWFDRKDFFIARPTLLTPDDKRVIFVIPQGDKVLVGTTEKEIKGNFFDIDADEDEVEYLIDNLRQFFPGAKLGKQDIAGTFAGIRPLIKGTGEEKRDRTTREHKIFQPYSNMFVLVGGKYTTFRSMGQQISRHICLNSGITYDSSMSKSRLYKSSTVRPFGQQRITHQQIKEILKNEKPRTFEDLVRRRLSIPNKNMWKGGQSFDQFFADIMPELKKYLHGDHLHY